MLIPRMQVRWRASRGCECGDSLAASRFLTEPESAARAERLALAVLSQASPRRSVAELTHAMNGVVEEALWCMLVKQAVEGERARAVASSIIGGSEAESESPQRSKEDCRRCDDLEEARSDGPAK